MNPLHPHGSADAPAAQVLVVAADSLPYEALRRSLQPYQFALIGPLDATEALKYYEHNAGVIDLVVVDTEPGGAQRPVEVIARLRRRNHGVKVVVCADRTSSAQAAAALSEGAVGLASKPFDAPGIQRLFHTAIERCPRRGRIPTPRCRSV